MMHMTQNMESYCQHLYGPGGDRILGLGVGVAIGRQIACQGAMRQRWTAMRLAHGSVAWGLHQPLVALLWRSYAALMA